MLRELTECEIEEMRKNLLRMRRIFMAEERESRLRNDMADNLSDLSETELLEGDANDEGV